MISFARLSYPHSAIYRCVSGQSGRFVYREQADFKRFFPSLKRTVRIDAFVVLVDSGGSEATVASTGDVAPVPYLSQVQLIGNIGTCSLTWNESRTKKI